MSISLTIIIFLGIYLYYVYLEKLCTEIKPSLILTNEKVVKRDYNSVSSSQELYIVSGRIINQSTDYDLTDYRIIVTFYDCKAQDDCIIVAEGIADNFRIAVPAGQARDMSSVLSFNEPVHSSQLINDFYKLIGVGRHYSDLSAGFVIKDQLKSDIELVPIKVTAK